MLFEELGFQYIGPVDGHNMGPLVETLRNVKRFQGPLMVHVMTRKGKGYLHAEDDPEKFHGISTFELTTGTLTHNAHKTYTDIFGDAMIELAKKDDKIVAITAAMGLGTGLDKFSDLFPERFYDIGIAEQHGVTFAAALALGGLKPFVAIYSTFLQRAYDQIIVDVCLQDLPVVFAVDRSGLVGQDGPTHHGVFDLSYFRHIPNMVLMAPKDAGELKDMIYSAYVYNRPVAIRYPRGEAPGVPVAGGFKEIPLGTWELLKEGKDLTIIACGNMVYPALAAAGELEKKGISVGVINGRFIKPMDEAMLFDIASKTKKILTLEENTRVGGFGSGIMELLSGKGIFIPVQSMGIPDGFAMHGSQRALRLTFGLDKAGIEKAIKAWLRKE
jgi:1-deoxy-D-xylulose-5-phosphate synthase